MVALGAEGGVRAASAGARAPVGAEGPAGRLILVGFFLAVAAFVGATTVSALLMREVSVRSAQIDSNVFPRVVALSTLRERVRELLTGLDDAIDSGGARSIDAGRLTAEIREEQALLARYPMRGRADDLVRIQEHVRAAVSAAAAVAARLAAGDTASAQAAMMSELRPAAASADRELWELAELSANEGEVAARRIDRVRQSATVLSFVLDAFCVAIASTFAVVSLRAVRRHARLVEIRSNELEQFAVRVAHDLRSPLTPVLFALQQTSRRTPQDDPARPTIDRAVRSVGRVTTLVEDLLAFAQAGGEIDRSARTSAVEVVRATLDDARADAQAASIQLGLEAPRRDVVVACPSGVLTSIVSNLVRNAVKYMASAAERCVVVRVVAIDRRARVEVADTGPGLPEGAVDRVFEPYVRADRTGQPGLGLGLSTVKRLVEAYGGRVGVRSTPAGCTFWFELPAPETADGAEPRAAAAS
ncbi:MAG TPA: HAMP domain-containing sensor histidine kinase [Polyangiaceae bacterium]|nr:HAMP domain-containing sensor histidine kinase [Polyangiaceae bacterium]